MIKYSISIQEIDTESENGQLNYFRDIIVDQVQLIRLLLELAKIREEEK